MKRNKFSLSHYKLLSCDMGELVPISLLEVLPGDTIQQATSLLVRCSPLLAPVMHPVHVRIHHWFVPHRLSWTDNGPTARGWEGFITGGSDGLDAQTFPTIALPSVSAGSLADYLGVPISASAISFSALPMRAYARIWNEWYRDQDLETPVPIGVVGGNDPTTNTGLLNCDWEKDYFTSSRPFPQKGPTVTIPIGTSAPVYHTSGAAGWVAFQGGTNTPAAAGTMVTASGGVIQSPSGQDIALSPAVSPAAGLFADLSSASSINVTALRQALALQRYEEARARYGSRYVEYLRYLGVRSSDARLQKPEYLGGGRNTIQFSEVLQTGPGTSSSVGELKGHGIASVRSNRYRRFFEEHGYVLTLLSVLPKTMYMQGLARTFNRRTKEDFWQQEFEHIGQQMVKRKEIYIGSSDPEGTFGYQDRYDEYRRAESNVSGDFKTSALNFWHFAREFGSEPSLNASFVKAVPTERVFAANTNDVLWIMARHSIQARRMLTKVGSSHIY